MWGMWGVGQVIRYLSEGNPPPLLGVSQRVEGCRCTAVGPGQVIGYLSVGNPPTSFKGITEGGGVQVHRCGGQGR